MQWLVAIKGKLVLFEQFFSAGALPPMRSCPEPLIWSYCLLLDAAVHVIIPLDIFIYDSHEFNAYPIFILRETKPC